LLQSNGQATPRKWSASPAHSSPPVYICSDGTLLRNFVLERLSSKDDLFNRLLTKVNTLALSAAAAATASSASASSSGQHTGNETPERSKKARTEAVEPSRKRTREPIASSSHKRTHEPIALCESDKGPDPKRRRKRNSSDSSSDSAEDADDSDKEYTVEALLDRRPARRGYNYLVAWEGYTADHNSWEPEANLLATSEESVREYDERHPK